MNRKLKSRGPDFTNIVIHNGYVFIHNLLHICGDLTPQPFIDNNIVILYNGEIYNYQDFGSYKSDGQCLIDLYKKYGREFIKKLDGEFGIVLFDFNKNEIIISSDIFATKPIWYYKKNDKILISTFDQHLCEILEIKQYQNKNIDTPKQINNWKNENNLIKNIPNQFITLNLKTLNLEEKQTIYNFDLNQHKKTYDDWFLLLKTYSEKSLQNINQNISISLSSGYDSGCIHCALDNLKIKFNSYTITAQENINTIKKE